MELMLSIYGSVNIENPENLLGEDCQLTVSNTHIYDRKGYNILFGIVRSKKYGEEKSDEIDTGIFFKLNKNQAKYLAAILTAFANESDINPEDED